VVTKLSTTESSSLSSALDTEIPALHVVFDRQQFRPHLAQSVPREWGEIEDIQFQVLQRHRSRRWTIEIALETTSGKHELIGKVYAEDHEDVYRAMKQVSAAGFTADAEFSIPEPLAYLPQLNLLLIEKVEGSDATGEFVKEDVAALTRAAERCAQWLAHFHNSAPKLGVVYEMTAERMQGWVSRLVSPFRSLEDKAELLSKQLARAANALTDSQLSACHGGFWHDQIILGDRRVVTVDWDNHCTADPARDLAKFIVELEQLALRTRGSLNALDPTIQVFCRIYESNSKFQVNQSLPVYKAAVCLKRAKYHLRRNGGGPEQADTMLEEGLQALAHTA
jgi:aminoglycoside phosphotransferase (APT) family kinase protein